jgi:hypothetical protein
MQQGERLPVPLGTTSKKRQSLADKGGGRGWKKDHKWA